MKKNILAILICFITLIAVDHPIFAANDIQDTIIYAYLNFTAPNPAINVKDVLYYKDARNLEAFRSDPGASALRKYYYRGLFTGYKSIPLSTMIITHFQVDGVVYAGTILRESYAADSGSPLVPTYCSYYSGYLTEDRYASISLENSNNE